MARRPLLMNVYDAAFARIKACFDAGHRVVFTCSGGKDSGVCVELGIEAARETGHLPIEVVMRDEEIMFPGTWEYAAWMASRPEIKFTWVYANQPIVNILNREDPFFWTFDPEIPRSEWVREPPDFAVQLPDKLIENITSIRYYPPPEGKKLVVVLGLRAQESMARRMGIASSRGFMSVQPDPTSGAHLARPIYDWDDKDVWTAIKLNGWQYNTAYDVLARFGLPIRKLRMAPPTMTAGGVELLQYGAKAWPQWFDKVCQRCPGVRSGAMFGKQIIEPLRRYGETWEQAFLRECILEAPVWIAARALWAREHMLEYHTAHSLEPYPEVNVCPQCHAMGSWRSMAKMLYCGDPFALHFKQLPEVQPMDFRPGAGYWEERCAKDPRIARIRDHFVPMAQELQRDYRDGRHVAI